MINAKDYWFKLECLLYKLGVETINPHGMMRRILLAEFLHACRKHTGITEPFYINGRAVELHEF